MRLQIRSRCAAAVHRSTRPTIRWPHPSSLPRQSHLPRQFHSISRLHQAQTTDAVKPFFVTTPIFYVNSVPHLGHLYSTVVADVFRRFAELRGKPAHLLTGTDEHGLKIQQAAQDRGLSPSTFVAELADVFKRLAHEAGCTPGRFLRTTDTDHKEVVAEVWRSLVERGWVELKEHKGWYCVSEEAFYPESSVKIIVDKDGKERHVTRETEKEVQYMAEENFHFKLSAFQDKLLEFFSAKPDFITPPHRYNEVVQEVKNGLTDLSISRSKSRLSWGIPVPDAPDQTIYVWLDALFNYLTYARSVARSSEHKTQIFPPDVQIIGKDILKFHAIYWPAFLMALDMPLPGTLVAHGHLLLSSKKMSKSDKNVVDPFELISNYGVDTIRFYLLHDGPLKDDAEFSQERLLERYNAVLKNDLGNNVSRMQTKQFEQAEVIQHYAHKGLDILLETHKEYCKQISDLPGLVTRSMEQQDPTSALKHIVRMLTEVSRFFHNMEPWKKENADTKPATVYLTGESLRIIGILLQAFIPSKAKDVLDILEVSPERRRLEDAVLGGDFEYGVKSYPKKKRYLFPPLDV